MVNVQVGEQDVDFPHIRTEELTQPLYARPGIEDDAGVSVSDLYAGGIASILIIFRSGSGQ
jgi:hypothetical protein